MSEQQYQIAKLSKSLTALGCLLWAGGVILLMFAGCGMLLLGGR